MTNEQIDPVVEQRRQDYIEALYQASGRTNGLYTGLMLERIKALVDLDMALTLDGAAQ